MKTRTPHLPLFAALLLGSTLMCNVATATTIVFSDTTALSNAFPTQAASGMYATPAVSGTKAVLLAGDLTLLNTNRQGRISLYSASTYSSGLNFINNGLSLTFKNARLDTPRGTTWAKFGITNANSGALGSDDGIYMIFKREGTADNSFVSLMQSVGGVETELTNLYTGNFGTLFSTSSVSLTLTGTTWAVSLDRLKPNGDPDGTLSDSGTFGTAWTNVAWGSNTYLGLEAYQQNTAADGNTRYGQLTVGDITFNQIPEPGTTALVGMGLLLAGRLIRRRRA